VIHIFLAFLLVTTAASLTGEFSSYSIHLLESGDALFVITERIPLSTPEDLEAWEVFASNYSLSEEYEEIISMTVSSISKELGREMSVSDFNLSLYLSPAPGKSYGVIEYSFLWRNFSVVRGNSLSCGDIFVGGFYISSSETLSVIIPDGFSLVEASPSPDELRDNELIWYGPKEFRSGEPRILVEKEEGLSWIHLTPALLIPFLYLLFRKRRGEEEKTGEEPPEDKELVLKLLRESGGSMLQSEIVRKTGFSKSKVSVILSKLQKEGKVEKVMKGRENLIRLKKS